MACTDILGRDRFDSPFGVAEEGMSKSFLRGTKSSYLGAGSSRVEDTSYDMRNSCLFTHPTASAVHLE